MEPQCWSWLFLYHARRKVWNSIARTWWMSKDQGPDDSISLIHTVLASPIEQGVPTSSCFSSIYFAFQTTVKVRACPGTQDQCWYWFSFNSSWYGINIRVKENKKFGKPFWILCHVSFKVMNKWIRVLKANTGCTYRYTNDKIRGRQLRFYDYTFVPVPLYLQVGYFCWSKSIIRNCTTVQRYKYNCGNPTTK